ncbi:MAG: hypothetical protein PHC62_09710 [Candidatus Izemoplasmatales bacterium]|nr:hypothetical protein [Candidatus Izemoplasmatales bacterium]
MKKYIIILITCCFIFLVSCQKETYNQVKTYKFNFQVYTSPVYIEKDVILGRDKDIISSCTTDQVILDNKAEIELFISSLNSIENLDTYVMLDIASYRYKITLGDNVISVVDGTYFYFNNVLFILKTGNFDFLDEYTFAVFC